jgi:hypothetical protein
VETVIVATLLFARNRLKLFKEHATKLKQKSESEFFVTAGRTLKTGVVSNAIVASGLGPLLQRYA